jgi:hypothetical protein
VQQSAVGTGKYHRICSTYERKGFAKSGASIPETGAAKNMILHYKIAQKVTERYNSWQICAYKMLFSYVEAC